MKNVGNEQRSLRKERGSVFQSFALKTKILCNEEKEAVCFNEAR